MNITVQSSASDSLTVKWEPPVDINGIIGSYNVTCASSEGDNAGSVVEGIVLVAEITGLLACETYDVTVAATTEGGEGPASDAVQEQTKEGKII